MAGLFDLPPLTPEDYANLPPLVRKGEDREQVIERVVTGWCTSMRETDPEKHVAKGGFMLDRVALVDENTGEPIDLGELVRRVEERLLAERAPEEFEFREELHIILRACRVDECRCSGLKIRPRWTTYRVAFGEHARFGSSTFGDDASFHAAAFGDCAQFDCATFGNYARFGSATFGDSARFDSADFGDEAQFDSAKFGHLPRFDFITFGWSANFDFATFGRGARFAFSTFDFLASFDSATFGERAQFGFAEFGDWASFHSTTFGESVSCLNATFGEGGGIEGAAVGRPSPPGRFGLCRRWERLAEWFDWTRVRSLGQLQVLTKVSYVALVVVPLLAGAWPAVRAAVNWINDDVRAAASEFHTAADRLDQVRSHVPASGPSADTFEHGVQRVREIEQKLGERSLKEPNMPPSWVLAFFGALCVVGGHLVYQVAAGERVRAQSRLESVRERTQEFRQASPAQRQDLLIRAFRRLAQVAGLLPASRHRNLVGRGGKTVWIPYDLEELRKVRAREVPAVEEAAPTGEPAAETADDAPSPAEVAPAVGVATEAQLPLTRTRPGDALVEGKTSAHPGPRPKFTREELELIVIDEGARAKYDVKARQRLNWAVVSGALYSGAVLCILWLVALQAEAVLRAAGLIDHFNVSVAFKPLAVVLAGIYAIGGVAWLVRRFHHGKSVPTPRPE